MAMTVLVCYDISDDTTRARVAATLQQIGDRIQRSVFVCLIESDQLTPITARLHDLIDSGTDAVHLLPLCGACWDRIIAIGQADVHPETLYWAVL
jgi:CRISPR-associated protein Cas2